MATDIENLPTAYFDPLWFRMKNSASYKRGMDCKGGMTSFPKRVNPSIISNPVSHFFSRCRFVSPWHNQWEFPFVEGSTADLFRKVYEQELLV
jgi:hypothetical protein